MLYLSGILCIRLAHALFEWHILRKSGVLKIEVGQGWMIFHQQHVIYRLYSNTIRILIKPAPLIEPAVVLSKFPIIPAAKRAFHEIEPADCNRINTVF